VPKEKTLRDGNGRVARLARWLQQLPASEAVDALILEHKEEGEWKRMQVWTRAEVNQQLATGIDSAITELANELGAYLTARVVWFDTTHGVYWTEHALRVQPEDMEGMQAFGGDAGSIAIQNQRHQERVVNMHLGMFGSSMNALKETNAALLESSRMTAAENLRLREDLYAARSQIAELEQEHGRLQNMLDEALSAAEKSTEKAEQAESTGDIIKMITSAVGSQQPAQPAARRPKPS
jgi:hypothetical protein